MQIALHRLIDGRHVGKHFIKLHGLVAVALIAAHDCEVVEELYLVVGHPGLAACLETFLIVGVCAHEVAEGEMYVSEHQIGVDSIVGARCRVGFRFHPQEPVERRQGCVEVSLPVLHLAFGYQLGPARGIAAVALAGASSEEK